MSVHNELSLNHEITIRAMIGHVQLGNPHFGSAELEASDFTQEQKSKISDILNDPYSKDDTYHVLRERIVSVLYPNEDTSFFSPEILLKIFTSFHPLKEMSAVSCLNKYWHNAIPTICKEQLNSKDSITMAELINYNKRLNDDSTDHVFCHGKNLVTLDLSEAFFGNYYGGEVKKHSIQEKIIFDIIYSAAKHCKNIETLLITEAYIGNDVYASIAKNMLNITHLTTVYLHGNHIELLGKNCTKLISLHVESAVLNAQILAIANHMPTLRELRIRGYPLGLNMSFTDESITTLAKKCPYLTHLSIKTASISIASVRALFNHCTELQHLSLSDCKHIEQADIDALGNQIPPNLQIDLKNS